MIRRSWVIYQRKTRRIVSTVYHRYQMAKADLQLLNDYCQKRAYVIQVIKNDSETGKVVSKYPDVQLKEIPKQEDGYG
jgi:phage terminase small subunit